MRTRALTGVSLIVFAGLVALAAAHGETVLDFQHALDRWGVRGVVALILAEALWTMTTIPSAPVMALAGIVYGVWFGALYVMIGNMLGASVTFWVGRTLARDRVRAWLDRHEGLEKAMRMVERHAVLSVLVVRVAPVFPLNLLTYGFGVTNMRFRTYLIASMLGTLPGVALYTGLGEGMRRIAAGEGIPTWVYLWVAGAAVFLVCLARFAKRHSAETA